jgi:hypothetical protein
MKQAKDIVAMVIDDSGNYVALAVQLAKEFKEVLYCNPSWVASYPNPNLTLIGCGIEEITVVENPFDDYDRVDFWIFPDTYYGAFQEMLRAQGEITWGSGAAEELELYRQIIKEEMKSLGLPVGEYEVVHGMTELRKHLQKKENRWIKPNKWRGLIETFFSENYDLVKPELDDIEYNKGIDSELIDFISEVPIPGKEMGYDGYTVDGLFPEAWISGAEAKDKVYIGQWKKYTDLPSEITDFNTKFAPSFKEYGYKGFFSLENRIADKDKKSFMTDFTARMPCPPGAIYLAMISNLGEVMWAGANGQIVPAKPVSQFGIELLIESNWAITHTCAIYFPKEVAKFIKLKKYRIKDGVYQIVPIAYGTSDIGSIVGLGDSIDQAKKAVLHIAEVIKGTEISIRIDALDNAEEALKSVIGTKETK